MARTAEGKILKEIAHESDENPRTLIPFEIQGVYEHASKYIRKPPVSSSLTNKQSNVDKAAEELTTLKLRIQ